MNFYIIIFLSERTHVHLLKLITSHQIWIFYVIFTRGGHNE